VQCTQLTAISGLDVAFPNSSLYAATESAYWSVQEALLAPLCIAKPSSSQDVASIIEAITNQDYCPFAIKSQGHAPASGFANIENGITIDLAQLSAITTNEDASVARIGTGASWLDVYAHLDTLNKTVAGGRNGGVGVGGLTLGGGISYFSPQAGFTCDSVINFEMVLASGRLVSANATSRPDLFRALKGGLSNFGVVRYPTVRSRYVLDIETSYLTPLFDLADFLPTHVGD
jgi:FAD/FMN-containing dehydrogenase